MLFAKPSSPVRAALCSTLSILIYFTAAISHGEPSILVDREIINATAYGEVTDVAVALFADEVEYETARNDPDFVIERVIYKSDGLNVVGFLYRARRDDSARPTVVFNRGSYVRQEDTLSEILVLANRFGEAGFTVFAPMYRGSEGGEGRDEMGGADLNDLMIVQDLANELEVVDATNLFLYGESRGGMMVYQAIRDGFPARAAATFGAFSDLLGLIESQPDAYGPLTTMIWPDIGSEWEDTFTRRSAIRWPEKLTETPLLIMHGAKDQSVPPKQALKLASKLAELDADYQLVIWGGDNHAISRHSKERDEMAIDWFRSIIQVK